VQGVDDVLAILLALASREEELEITLISVTFGNIDVRKFAQLSSKFVLQRLTPFIAAYGTLWRPSTSWKRSSNGGVNMGRQRASMG
jgi:inosine-uridine nucleoside N-ribohydrolase